MTTHPDPVIDKILTDLDAVPDGDAGDDLELELLRDLRDHVKGQASQVGTCQHCERPIKLIDGSWIDPQATGDDTMWRETCDANDTDRAAAHEPTNAQEG